MKRRHFITLLGGAAVAWPLAARAQQAERVRLIGVLMNLALDDSEGKIRLASFRQALQELGWTDGRNIRIEIRGAAGDPAKYRQHAAELVALAPDAILAITTASVVALQQVSRILPLVFVQVIDPLGSGLVASLARPGGNATGFMQFEYAISAKWLANTQIDRLPALAADLVRRTHQHPERFYTAKTHLEPRPASHVAVAKPVPAPIKTVV